MKQKNIIIFLIVIAIMSALFFCASYSKYEKSMIQNQKQLTSISLQKEELNRSKAELEALITTSETYLSEIDTIHRYSVEYDIPPEVILAVMKMESNFDVNAFSGSSYGLMQINEIHLDSLENKLDILGVDKNIEYGTSMLSMLQAENKDLHYVLNSYNMGKAGYANYVAKTGNASRDYSRKGIEYINKLKQ